MTIHIVDENSSQLVDVKDRCFNYGDGCFTTIFVNNGVAELLDAHIKRLALSCERLFITGVCFDELKQTLVDVCSQYSSATVVKVLISRGVGGRGYQLPTADHAQTCIYITHSPFPQNYNTWLRSGISLGVSTIKLGINPHLSGIKHCNRLEQVLVKQAFSQLAGEQKVDDVVVLDVNNHVVECSASNLFWLVGDTWYTPSLGGSGVAGVMREFIVGVLKTQQIAIEFVDVGLTELFNADGMFICNALTGPLVVNQIDFGTEIIRRQGQGLNILHFKNSKTAQLVDFIRQQLMSRTHVS